MLNRCRLHQGVSVQVGELLAEVCSPNSDTYTTFVQVKELRERTKNLPDDYLVTLVGDMITEEGLPTYMTMLNTLDGVRDDTGASASPWAKWTRAWTAEENRHGVAPHLVRLQAACASFVPRSSTACVSDMPSVLITTCVGLPSLCTAGMQATC
jgi:hypothetical protein